MKIGFVGGGTGGHFYPLIAVAQEIRDRKNDTEIDLYYFGPNIYNQELLQKYDIKFSYVPAGKIRRYSSAFFLNILDVFKITAGIFVAILKLYWYYPDVIFSKGGYTSVPILIAAWFLRIPVVIHESDVIPGRANKLAGRFAKYIAISWTATQEFFDSSRVALTGIPIRRELRLQLPNAREVLSLPSNIPVVYVTGGSLGADRINKMILKSLDKLLPHMVIYHQAGEDNVDRVRKTARELLVSRPELLENYYVVGSLDAATVNAVLCAADLVVTRAGTTTLYEISAHNKPAIVIPIPEEISHDQRTNAYTYARNGAAVVMEESNLTPNLLQTELFSIITDVDKYYTMRNATSDLTSSDASNTISDILISIGYEHKS